MSCKEIIPKVVIEGVAVSQSAQSDAGVDTENKFDPDSDEEYILKISHTALVQVDSFLDSFSLNDILEATVGSSNFYSAKFFLTNDPETYKSLLLAIKLSEQASSYYNDSTQTATPEQIISLINEVEDGEEDPKIPDAVEQTVKELNKCAFKVEAKKAKSSKASKGKKGKKLIKGKGKEVKSSGGSSTGGSSSGGSSTTDTKTATVKTYASKLVKALNNNDIIYNDVVNDKILSWTRPIYAGKSQATIEGNPPVPTISDSDFFSIKFGVEQLKNLYLVVVPNVEYRENKKLIFTLRNYFGIPLVVNYEPQMFGGTLVEKEENVPVYEGEQGSSYVSGLVSEKGKVEKEKAVHEFLSSYAKKQQQPKFINQKKVVVRFLKQPLINLERATSLFDDIKKTFGKDAYKTYIQNIKPQSFVTEPMVSIGHHGEVVGVFFLDLKMLAKNLTSYEGLLNNEEVFKGFLQKITVKKVYSNGEEVELWNLSPIGAYRLQEVIAYKFVDEYDLKDFKYVISVEAKNPLESLLTYVLPNLDFTNKVFDSLISKMDKKVKTGLGWSLTKNPISGFFTDDYLGSDDYKEDNKLFKTLQKNFVSLYNSLRADTITLPTNELVYINQLFDWKKLYESTDRILSNVARAESINIVKSVFGTKPKGNKNKEPYRTLFRKFDKPYKASSHPVFFDFLYETPPSPFSPLSEGAIDKKTLLKRIEKEGKMLDKLSVGINNGFTDSEGLFITPVSIMIDGVSVDITKTQTIEEEEDVTANVLMSANLEVKDPNHTFTGASDALAGLLALDNTIAVSTIDKKLKINTNTDNFIPTDMKNARPTLAGTKKLVQMKSLKESAKAKDDILKQELSKKTAKMLYLEEADMGSANVPSAVKQKLSIPNTPDKQHWEIADKLGAEGYTKNPATFVTRLLNSYQLEYLAGFTQFGEPVFYPLTKGDINKISLGTIGIGRLLPKTPFPISKDYTQMHRVFLITDESGEFTIPTVPLFTIFEGLPKPKGN